MHVTQRQDPILIGQDRITRLQIPGLYPTIRSGKDLRCGHPIHKNGSGCPHIFCCTIGLNHVTTPRQKSFVAG